MSRKNENNKSKRTSDYVCFDCGTPFLDDSVDSGQYCTYFKGVCGLCNESKLITHIRNYNYLNKK